MTSSIAFIILLIATLILLLAYRVLKIKKLKVLVAVSASFGLEALFWNSFLIRWMSSPELDIHLGLRIIFGYLIVLGCISVFYLISKCIQVE